jgi:tripartite-type tricarboxylate transporter receptor subunit TctC
MISGNGAHTVHVSIFKSTGCLAACVLTCGASALAQDKPANYPARPVRIIVTVSPGAGADTVARAAGQIITERWGQSVVVDNRPGGAGVIGADLVAKSAPDGYTILSFADGMMLLGATKRVPYDVRTTFDPIVNTTMQPYILMVGLNLPAKNMKELVAYSATQTLTYGSSGVGGTVHLGMERLARITGGKFMHVPYKGTAPSIVGVIGGEIHMVAGSAIAATGAIKTGKVRGLAVMGPTRVAALPELPTLAEQGISGFTLTNHYALFAPAGTPRPILAALNRVVSDGMHAPKMAQRFAAEGAQPGERKTPDELKTDFARDYLEVEQQVKQLNLNLN